MFNKFNSISGNLFELLFKFFYATSSLSPLCCTYMSLLLTLLVLFIMTKKLSLRWMYGMVNKDLGILMTPLQKMIPPQTKEKAIASYEEHNTRVRQVIPPHLLLEYNIADGWEPLCTFLNISECPRTPFPKTNSSLSVIVQTSTGLFIFAVSALFGSYSIYLLGCKIAKCLGNTNKHSSEMKFQNGTKQTKNKHI